MTTNSPACRELGEKTEAVTAEALNGTGFKHIVAMAENVQKKLLESKQVL